jgi:CPA2 family monovalent cation:H+ antiporter-2
MAATTPPPADGEQAPRSGLYHRPVEHTAVTVLEVGTILLAAAAAGWLARRATLPAIVGYLAVGLAVSPFTPGYVADREQVSLFAEVGAVLLLFEVGIEVDLRELRREHPKVLWAAPLQMAISFGVSVAAFAYLGLDLVGAALIGLAVAMSSSVVVVNITRSRRRTTDRETEHLLIGWSVLQDVIGVAVAIILLAAIGGGRPLELTLLGIVGFAALAILSARILPRVLARTRSEPDLFLAVSVAAGLAVAGAGALLTGIPLALAAFIAGLTITEGPVSAEARKRLLPFRDLFAIFFFVSIGTLIDPSALGRGLGWLVLSLALVAIAKTLVIYLLGRLARLPANAGQLAVGLGQIGEFGFVLATVAVARGVLPGEVYAALLAAVAASIAVSSIAVRLIRPTPAPLPSAATG